MFVPTPKSVDNTCVNQQVELVCCAHNYRLLRWYHYDNTSSHTWEEVKLSSHVYHSPEGDNRTLVLQKPALSDRGWYRCTAEDGMGHKISHNISLYIEGRGPVKFVTLPCGDVFWYYVIQKRIAHAEIVYPLKLTICDDGVGKGMATRDVEGILPKGPYPPCLRMADRALLAGYPRCRDDTTDVQFCNTLTTIILPEKCWSLPSNAVTLILLTEINY